MGNQHSLLEFDSTEQMFWDFQEIGKNKNIISSVLENVDWVTAFKSQWCWFILRTISQKSGKIDKFLGTSPNSIKQTEEAIKQTMAK